MVVIPGSATVEMRTAAVATDLLGAGLVGALCLEVWVRRHVGAPVPIAWRSVHLAPKAATSVITSARDAFGSRHATTRPSGRAGSLRARHVASCSALVVPEWGRLGDTPRRPDRTPRGGAPAPLAGSPPRGPDPSLGCRRRR